MLMDGILQLFIATLSFPGNSRCFWVFLQLAKKDH